MCPKSKKLKWLILLHCKSFVPFRYSANNLKNFWLLLLSLTDPVTQQNYNVRVALLFLVVLLLQNSTTLLAQERCATVNYNKALYKKLGVDEPTEKVEQWIEKKIAERKPNPKQGQPNLKTLSPSEATYKIPVVVHVIHNGELVGVGMNVSDARIHSQIKVLNDDFNRLNSDKTNTPAAFESLAGSFDIEFVLAKTSPDGQPTTGIVRVNGGQSSWSVIADQTLSELKSKSYWPSDKYLNIWVTSLTDYYLGLAQYPLPPSGVDGLNEGLGERLATTDGVVIHYSAFGVGSEELSYNLGRTTTHEVGHFLGLRHIWGDNSSSTCATDYVDDTPPQTLETTTCPSSVLTDNCSPNAPGVMYQNYMDYTDDACMNLFTQGQINRMQVVLENGARRASLLNSPGLLPVSGLEEDLEIASINLVKATCNPNNIISLVIKNNSIEEVTINSFKINYKVNNGVTQTQVYTGLLLPAGQTYAVNLAITLKEGINAVFVDVHSPNNFADVNPANNQAVAYTVLNTSRQLIPIRENFNTQPISWSSLNPLGGTKWEIITTNGNFKKSAYFNGYNNPFIGEEGWLISPLLDLTYGTTASLHFDLSYGWASPRGLDKLKVLASTNCGESFDYSLLEISGTEMANYPYTTAWFPQSDDDWKKNGVLGRHLNLSSLIGERYVVVAFVAENKGGNNIFIDNVEFSLSDSRQTINNYSIYWITHNQSLSANISFNLPTPQPAGFTVLDITGRELVKMNLGTVQGQTFNLPVEKSPQGFYIVRLQIGSQFYTTKLYLRP
jgi:hypothetical protein